MSTDGSRARELDFHKKELVISELWDSIMSEELPHCLGIAIGKIAAYAEHKRNLKKIRGPSDESVDYTPFGIAAEPPEITLTDKREIQSEIEKRILRSYPERLEKLETITDEEIRKLLKREDSDGNEHKRQRIIDLYKKSYERLERMYELNADACGAMKEWIDSRLNSATLDMERRAFLLDRRTEINELKAKLISAQMKKYAYRGTTTIRNYMEYYLNMKAKLDDYKKDIQHYKNILHREEDEDED